MSNSENLPDLSQSQKKADEPILPYIEGECEGWFNKITELHESNVIVKINCKFCQHSQRAAAEKRWEETHNYTSVCKFFDEFNKNNPEQAVVMNVVNVRTHILAHYEETQRRILIKEYCGRLTEMMNYKLSKAKMFESIQTSIYMKYLEIASSPEIDKIKQSETMAKLAKALAEAVEFQAKLTGDIKSTEVIAEKFIGAWIGVISQEKNPENRRRLMETLDIFKNEIGNDNEAV